VDRRHRQNLDRKIKALLGFGAENKKIPKNP
jgi:hypothetical protein